MKRLNFSAIFLAVVIVGMGTQDRAVAHEGHDHDTPATVKAPKGGMIKGIEQTWIEVVSKGQDIKIYLYDLEMKPKAPTGFKVQAEAELPRKNGKSALNLKETATGYETSYDAKGSHRYILNLKVTDPSEGHEDKLNFTIEPKK